MKEIFNKNKTIIAVIGVIVVVIIILLCLKSCGSNTGTNPENGTTGVQKATAGLSDNVGNNESENSTKFDKTGQDETKPANNNVEQTSSVISEKGNTGEQPPKAEQPTKSNDEPVSEPVVQPGEPVERPTEPESEPESVPTTPTVPQVVHTHSWVERTETVHHEAVTHIEHIYVMDKAAYDENVYARKVICKQCGAMFDNADEEYVMHIKASNGACGSYRTEKVLVDVIHHEEVGHYEDKEIIDIEAYDEVVAVWYECINCGEKR